MKVLFLDHDGVICLSNNWGSRYKKQKKWGGRKMSMTLREVPIEFRFDNFDKKAIKVLNEVLSETNTEIVVSSDWKLHGSLEDIGKYYELMGIIKKPIDFTPDMYTQNKTIEFIRSLEIKKWLENNDKVTNWVSVDDLDMSLFLGENFVLTPKENEGIKQSGIKEKLIKILNNNEPITIHRY
jgi:hypothetical protein